MVHTRAAKEVVLDVPESSAGHGHGQAPHNNAPAPLPLHPPVSLEQLLATHNDLMRLLMEKEMRRGTDQQQPQQQDKDCSYSDFSVTQPLIFAEATEPVEADN
jgi:hypothetical protein